MAGSDAADVRYGMHASHDRQGVSIIRTCMLAIFFFKCKWLLSFMTERGRCRPVM